MAFSVFFHENDVCLAFDKQSAVNPMEKIGWTIGILGFQIVRFEHKDKKLVPVVYFS